MQPATRDATVDGNARTRVLVVEDEPSIAALVRMYLEREGFEVDTAADGPSALTAVAAHSPAAVVLDIGLPGVDGLEVCRRLRAAPGESARDPVRHRPGRGGRPHRRIGTRWR